jgi:hypothetical protein
VRKDYDYSEKAVCIRRWIAAGVRTSTWKERLRNIQSSMAKRPTNGVVTVSTVQ